VGPSPDVLRRLARLAHAIAFLGLAAVSCTGDERPPGDSDPTASFREQRLYVTSGFTDEVIRIDPADGSITGRIPVERRRDEIDEPHAVVVSPDAEHWYVTVAHGEPTLWKYELAGDRLVGRVALPAAGAARIGITPDGERAFIPDYDRTQPGVPGRVSVVDLADMNVVAAPFVCAGPHHAAVDPTGRNVAIACSLGDEIVIMDAVSLEVRSRFAAGPEAGPPGQPALKPLNLAWSSDGETIWAGLHLAASVRAYHPDGEIVATVETGDGPAQIALSPDGRTLVVANRGDASLSVIDTRSMSEAARIPLEVEHPHGLALDAAGRRAFVSCEGTPRTMGRAVAVDLKTGSILWSTVAGAYTLGAAYVVVTPE